MVFVSEKIARQEGLSYTEVCDDCDLAQDFRSESFEDRAITEFYAWLKSKALDNQRPSSRQAC